MLVLYRYVTSKHADITGCISIRIPFFVYKRATTVRRNKLTVFRNVKVNRILRHISQGSTVTGEDNTAYGSDHIPFKYLERLPS